MERNDIIVERFSLDQIRRITSFPLICIYNSPADYPGCFAARLWDINKPTRYIAVAETLSGIRDVIPNEMIPFRRDQRDDPCIVETWI